MKLTDATLNAAAKVAYENYCYKTNWRSVATGDILPPWYDLSVEVQDAWKAAVIGLDEFYQEKRK